MRRLKQIGSIILLCLVAAVGVFLGRDLRVRQENALDYDFSYTHCIQIANMQTGTYKSVLDLEALKARRNAQGQIMEEIRAQELNLTEPERAALFDAVPFEESARVRGDKTALYSFFNRRNLILSQPGSTPREWLYQMEFILRDKFNTVNPDVDIYDDFRVYVDQDGVLIVKGYYFETGARAFPTRAYWAQIQPD